MSVLNLRVTQLDPNSSADRSRLVKFPFKLYKGDPYWVPQLIGDRRKYLDPKHNPSFEYLKVAYFVAEATLIPESTPKGTITGGMEQDVGIIAAIVNPRHNALYHDTVGFFGLFETINNQEVANALFNAAGAWLAGQGCSVMRGPITFTISDEVGLLIDGFDDAPRIMMTYNPPYYPDLLDSYGFAKAMDLYAYKWDLMEMYGGSVEGFPPKLIRVVEKLKQRTQLTIHKIDMKHFDEEVAKIQVIYRDAWKANWGEVPLTDDEIAALAKQLKQVLDPNLVFLVEIEGKTVGVGLTVPDANFVLKKMGGHIFPFGFVQMLRYQNKIQWVRVLILGVLPEYRQLGVDAVMYYETAKEALARGYRYIEGSWILEINDAMNRVIQNFGAVIYKTYRLYDKDL